MEKKRKWQFILILAVIALTIYNILPTLFFYSKPLNSPVSKELAQQIAKEIATRVDELEAESIDWLHSYCRLLNVHPQFIKGSADAPHRIDIKFAKTEEAQKLRTYLPRAGLLIPFAPAQLQVLAASDDPKEIIVERKLPLRLTPLLQEGSLFEYIPKIEDDAISIRYQSLIQNRLRSVMEEFSWTEANMPLLSLAASILEIGSIHEEYPQFAARLASRFAKTTDPQKLLSELASARDHLKAAKAKLTADAKELPLLESQEATLGSAELFLKKRISLFVPSNTSTAIVASEVDLEKSNPFFQHLSIDWVKSHASLRVHPDLEQCLAIDGNSSNLCRTVHQMLVDEIAKVSYLTNETLIPRQDGYIIPLQEMEELSGVLAINTELLTNAYIETLANTLRKEWKPNHADLSKLPIVSEKEYETLSSMQKSLCLIVSAKKGSLFVTAKGMSHILRALEGPKNSLESQSFFTDFQTLASLLQTKGFSVSMGENIVFEHKHFLEQLLASTREPFKLFGSSPQAFLELSNVEQRIIALNKIETQKHEELLKMNDEYKSSQVSLHPSTRYDFPAPTRNIFWSNLKLNLKKMVRGDEKKILRWGLDLSGGKSVQIELRDQNNQIVTEDADLKQGINELFSRVNKMGVSDVSIRQVGHHIELDFPGSQALSAAELIKASSMSFHVVNEKFSSLNPTLGISANRFLQEVWNEAVVTKKQDLESVQTIAYRHLHGEFLSDAAKELLQNGLQLSDPKTQDLRKTLDDTKSMIAIIRETDAAHPLLIVFQNHVLEGSDLIDIRSNYDPSKGNSLSFDVQGSEARKALYAWTSAFSKEKIAGTPKEEFSRGNGWRMAVILNGSVISAPTLESPLNGSAQISGHFTQREINKLASDLKAGSLSFTPRILSEKNISPELGKTDRMKGIFATVAALFLVIFSMIAYYRFAGLIASIAVLFNLLILWAVLQNLGASLSLASIAGIILTVGMAVDANVLVFERMKEEFSISKKIASAIRAGYEKAFSAILDSNVTTIIAALILLNFDAGPIKAFAIAMIIGIASSMFTALFMTRVYFNHWLTKPRNTTLTMSNWIRGSNFNFLKKANLAFCIALALITIGSFVGFTKKHTLFGMDFTGGYSVHVELEKPDANASEKLAKYLVAQGLSLSDFQLRSQEHSSECQLLLSTALEQSGKPFSNLALSQDGSNPRLDWVLHAFEEADLPLSSTAKNSLASNWTAMSGQMSQSMRNSALLGLGLAFVGIFIYIAFRFEYKYAIAALLCLIHDVLITLGSIALLHAMKVPVQIDLHTIAAIMTIIGYSLNDTIIVFDRIREDSKLYPNMPMSKVINLALNTTLSRTTITSGTTLLVLVALLIFGGASIFSFALVMTLGVVFGTLSSWFIASPLMLFFHRKEEEPEVEIMASE